MPESLPTGGRSLIFYICLGLATLISILSFVGIFIAQWKMIDFQVPSWFLEINSSRYNLPANTIEPIFATLGSRIMLGFVLLIGFVSFYIVVKQQFQAPRFTQKPWNMNFITLFAFFMFWFVIFLGISFGSNRIYSKWINIQAPLFLILIPYILHTVWGILILLRFENISWSIFIKRFSFKLNSGDGLKIFQIFFLAMIIILAYSASINPFLKNADAQARLHEILGQSKSWKQIVPSLLAVGILAPLFEEIVFRGVLLTWLRQRIRLELAVLISGIVFAFFHMELVVFPALVLLGCVLAWSYVISESILIPICIHALWNTTAFLSQLIRS